MSSLRGAKRRSKFDAFLFDIDNVLIDTRASYLACIQKTVETYTNRPGVVTPKEIETFKLLGGFNDDWDSSYGIIAFLETAIQGKPIRFGDHRKQRLSISELAKLCPARPLGIEGLLKCLRIHYERVELPSYQRIARLFQEIYLGKKGKRKGLIQKEKLVFSKRLLEKIRKQSIRLGIVTGRSANEARYALRRFGILKLFDCLVTMDDVRRAEKRQKKSLRKPHPWSLIEAARRLVPLPKVQGSGTQPRQPRTFGRGTKRRLRFLYVGDLPDDVLAAKRARKTIRIESAAFVKLARDPWKMTEELKKLRPDYVLRKSQELLRVIASPARRAGRSNPIALKLLRRRFAPPRNDDRVLPRIP